MIARTWHGMVPATRADEYMAYLERTGLPDYRATPGNRGLEPHVTHYEVRERPAEAEVGR